MGKNNYDPVIKNIIQSDGQNNNAHPMRLILCIGEREIYLVPKPDFLSAILSPIPIILYTIVYTFTL